MKNNIIYISFSLVILLAGCAKKLDKEPLGLQVDQSFYKTSDDLIQAVNAAYDSLVKESPKWGASAAEHEQWSKQRDNLRKQYREEKAKQIPYCRI